MYPSVSRRGRSARQLDSVPVHKIAYALGQRATEMRGDAQFRDLPTGPQTICSEHRDQTIKAGRVVLADLFGGGYPLGCHARVRCAHVFVNRYLDHENELGAGCTTRADFRIDRDAFVDRCLVGTGAESGRELVAPARSEMLMQCYQQVGLVREVIQPRSRPCSRLRYVSSGSESCVPRPMFCQLIACRIGLSVIRLAA